MFNPARAADVDFLRLFSALEILRATAYCLKYNGNEIIIFFILYSLLYSLLFTLYSLFLVLYSLNKCKFVDWDITNIDYS